MFSRMFLILMLSGVIFASSAIAGTTANWELAYKHDGTGTRVSGDLSVLITAIQNGADVKVVLHSPISGDWVYVLKMINVDNNSVVTGFLDHLYALSNDVQDPILYQQLRSCSTNGETRVRYFNAPDVTNIVRYYSLSWYVNK